MKGTINSLCANVLSFLGRDKILQRIMTHMLPLFLTLPRRANFTQFKKWGGCNEMTYHNWFCHDLGLVDFNRKLIDKHGSGNHFVIFDPSYLSKSGKKTPSMGNFWSGGAGKSKLGLEMSCFAVGDLEQHTSYHLSSTLTPNPKDLKKEGKTLVDYYVSQVAVNLEHIQHYGNKLCADGYFGVSTFVAPVHKLGIHLTSCLRTNSRLFYAPEKVEGKRKRGRPTKKGIKLDWANIDTKKLPIVEQDSKKIVRSSIVYVDCLKMQVLLVAVDYLKDDGLLQSRKLYFSTETTASYQSVLECYGIRYQIEFIFRDAKQHTGLMHCQSTNATKMLNHINLSLTAINVAKATHWQKDEPFSMAEIKNYYLNLKMVELFSQALGLDPNHVKNNDKIKSLLFSNHSDLNVA